MTVTRACSCELCDNAVGRIQQVRCAYRDRNNPRNRNNNNGFRLASTSPQRSPGPLAHVRNAGASRSTGRDKRERSRILSRSARGWPAKEARRLRLSVAPNRDHRRRRQHTQERCLRQMKAGFLSSRNSRFHSDVSTELKSPTVPGAGTALDGEWACSVINTIVAPSNPMPQRVPGLVGAWGAAGTDEVSTQIDHSAARRARLC